MGSILRDGTANKKKKSRFPVIFSYLVKSRLNNSIVIYEAFINKDKYSLAFCKIPYKCNDFGLKNDDQTEFRSK